MCGRRNHVCLKCASKNVEFSTFRTFEMPFRSVVASHGFRISPSNVVALSKVCTERSRNKEYLHTLHCMCSGKFGTPVRMYWNWVKKVEGRGRRQEHSPYRAGAQEEDRGCMDGWSLKHLVETANKHTLVCLGKSDVTQVVR